MRLDMPARLLLVLALIAAPAFATFADPTCDNAAAFAAARSDVPLNVLRAITRVETGHRRAGRFTPWPWATNLEGAGAWHESRAAARAAILAALQSGRDSIDVGCFQINYRWHGQHFTDIDAMLDPNTNAVYAAQFLSALHTEFGDWTRAVGAFHSRTERYASRYRARFADVYAALGPAPAAAPQPIPAASPSPATSAPRDNRFPLLQSGAETAPRPPASLMPQGAAGSPMFGEG